MPFLKSNNRKLPDWLTNTPIAHRGFHNINASIVENSLSSFKAAIDAGLAIELDIQFSKDEVPMVFHDKTLERLTNSNAKLSEKTKEELSNLALSSTTDTIPSLEEVLNLVNGQVPLVLEIKPVSGDREKRVGIILALLNGYDGDYCIQSFDPMIVHQVKKLAPTVIRGQLGMKSPPKTVPAGKRFLITQMPLNRLTQPDYIGYDIQDLQSFKKTNRPILAWTVDDKEKLKKARKFADNIIFEDLALDEIAVT